MVGTFGEFLDRFVSEMCWYAFFLYFVLLRVLVCLC